MLSKASNLKILMFGDIFGKLGLGILAKHLPGLKNKFSPDFIIANGENSFHNGRGLNRKGANEIFEAGVDAITLGNHTWGQSELFDFIDQENRIIRPANFAPGTPGKGIGVFETRLGPLAVINLMGRSFMAPTLDCPFRAAEQIIENLPEDIFIFVDMHAETTSEKLSIAWHLDGAISALVGTHTHVQTADERILPKGTGYLSDVGMVGPYDGIIGMEREGIIRRYITQLPVKFVVAKGREQLNAVLFECDANTKKCNKITRIRIDDDQPYELFE